MRVYVSLIGEEGNEKATKEHKTNEEKDSVSFSEQEEE